MTAKLLRALTLLLISCVLTPVGAEDTTVTMYLKGSASAPTRGVADLKQVPSHFFQNNPDAKLRGIYRNVYPGIDMICLGDNYSTEYIFALQPGADPNLISCFFKGSTLVSLMHSGSLQFRKDSVQIYVSRPIAYLQKNADQELVRYLESRATSDGNVTVVANELVKETQQRLNGTMMNLIPGGGQPNGPMYDFFTSRFETTNDQLLYFLNDAQANQMNSRGSNTHFDKYGNIWINKAKELGKHELFSIRNSKFVYDAAQPVGHRYDHLRDPDDRPLYADHPAMGLSWYGSIKYCNWLTLHSGRGTSELCYSEGTNTYDWAPINATNWAKGTFTDLERYEWLKLKGFRLPMTGTNTSLLTPNPFNEFYKTAAWNSFTNLSFAFGQDDYDGTAANFENSPFTTAAGTLPTGFFSDNNKGRFKRLTPSANFYGLYDISGNAAEWTADSNGRELSVGGGAWSDPPLPVNTCYFLPPYYTAKSVGMRVGSTYMQDFKIRIHMLVTFFLLEEGLPPADIPEAVLFPYLQDPELPPGIASDDPDGTEISFTGSRSPTDYDIPTGITYTDTPEPPTVPDVSPPSPPSIVEPPSIIVPPIPIGPVGPPSTNTTTTTTTTTTTIPPVNPQFNLNVRSSNPGSGVWITVTPDITATGSGFTPYTRTYTGGTPVTVNAPLMAGINTFQRWQRDGTDFSTNQAIFFAMNTNYTVLAIYMYVPGTITNPPPSPGGI